MTDAMNWRPKDWQKTLGTKFGAIAPADAKLIEAGADAMLSSLRKVIDDKVEYCDSPGDNFTGIGWFISEDDWREIWQTQ